MAVSISEMPMIPISREEQYPSLMALISAQKINLDSAITLGLLEAGIPQVEY